MSFRIAAFLGCVAAATPVALQFGGAAPLGVAPEPWPPLNGGGFRGAPQPQSPDPLVRYEWDAGVNASVLQIFPVPATACGPAVGTAADSFLGAASAVGSVACSITVRGAGTLEVDFGVELPAWVEFDAVGVPADVSMSLGIGEYNAVDYVGGFKADKPVAYCGGGAGGACTYRLETNSELYEGVRYAFLTLASAPSAPFTITALRAVSQAKAVNYTGAFSSPGDPVLERVWWTAAYTVRATLQASYMGSILMDRGDRVSWTGDAHPTQAASMAAFSNYAFVFDNLNRTKSDCQGIATYCLYFVLSVADYFAATGDSAGVSFLTPYASKHLDGAAGMWANPQGLRFVGWGDRLGSGFANNTTPETQALYRLLAIRAWTEAAAFLNATGSSDLASKYAALAVARTADIRAMGGSPWYGEFGLHARAEAVTAGFLTPEEAAGIAAGPLGDIVVLPSQSNFNQYFILLALGKLGQLDRAVESVRVVWGAPLALGATTYWETSHPSAAEIFAPGPPAPPAEQSGWVSLCHPWSSGPTPWLSRWVVGVRPLEAGYGRALIAPHIAHSMVNGGVAGSVGTPHGVIRVNCSRDVDGSARIELALPAGVRSATLRLSEVLLARLGLPAVEALGGSLRSFSAASFVVSRAGVAAQQLAAVVAFFPDAPLRDESNVRGGRVASLELELAGGASYTLRIVAAAAAAIALKPPSPPLGSPFPPPSWPGALVGSDTTTGGSWLGKYGADGFVLIAFDVPSVSSNPFCAIQHEGSALQLECNSAGATVSAIEFASYGSPSGTCPSFVADAACNASSSVAVVTAACIGKHACSVDVSNDAFGGDPCPGTSKELAVVARCSSGGGSQPGGDVKPADRSHLPTYVSSARVVDYDGYCGARASWSNGTSDVRALQDPAIPNGPRHLGLTQPCGCPTSPFDIVVTDAAKASGLRYRLSAYFVDYAPAPSCGAFDGTARSQEVYLLTGYPSLNPAAPRTALADFSGGVWVTWEVQGDIRVRISTIRGDYAVLSAIAFDPVA